MPCAPNCALHCGRLLLQIKEIGKKTGAISHGQWEDWLKCEAQKRNAKLSPRTAREYMRLANKWTEIEAAAKRRDLAVLNLTKTDALKLIAEPKRSRQLKLREELDTNRAKQQQEMEATEREHEREW